MLSIELTQNASPPQTKEKLRQELGYILQRHIFVESKVDLVNGIEFKPGLKNLKQNIM